MPKAHEEYWQAFGQMVNACDEENSSVPSSAFKRAVKELNQICCEIGLPPVQQYRERSLFSDLSEKETREQIKFARKKADIIGIHARVLAPQGTPLHGARAFYMGSAI